MSATVIAIVCEGLIGPAVVIFTIIVPVYTLSPLASVKAEVEAISRGAIVDDEAAIGVAEVYEGLALLGWAEHYEQEQQDGQEVYYGHDPLKYNRTCFDKTSRANNDCFNK